MNCKEVIIIKKNSFIPVFLILFSITTLIQPVIADSLPHIEIIVDNPETIRIGDWWHSRFVPGYYGDNYVFSMKGNGSHTATWTFNLTYTGQWEVFAMWTNNSVRATNSPYTINYAHGSDTIRMNQQINGEIWNSLGSYDFEQGEATVVLSDDADGFVIADAIKFVYRTASFREQKEQILDILDQTESEDKKIGHSIDKMIEKIEKSLDNRLWADDNAPNSKHGNKIFDNEKKAVKHGIKIIKDKHSTEEVKENIAEAINNLINADRQLAENSYEQALTYSGNKKVDKELEKAQKYLEKANEELNKNLKNSKKGPKYHKVIDQLKKSWKHSQKALKHLEKLDQ
ncbi:MAG: golvesin C-terminal-like domain-containing protein [Candidatus Hermodarchaeia archaeon]